MRFRIRHVQQTVADHVEAHLAAMGWTADPHPWGIKPLKFVEVQPHEVVSLEPTIVSTLIEDEGNKDVEQLGGGLYSIDYELLVDVYAERSSVALSIASDVRDALENPIRLKDYTGSTPVEVPDALITFERVETASGKGGGGSTTAPDLKKAWRTVLAFANLTFSETT